MKLIPNIDLTYQLDRLISRVSRSIQYESGGHYLNLTELKR